MLFISFLKKASVISIVEKCGLLLMLFLFQMLNMRQVLLILIFFCTVSSHGQNNGQNSTIALTKADSLQIIKFQNRLKSANDKEKLELYYNLASLYLSKNDS